MYMFKYVSKRLGLMLFTFFIIFTMCFVLIKLLPIIHLQTRLKINRCSVGDSLTVLGDCHKNAKLAVSTMAHRRLH